MRFNLVLTDANTDKVVRRSVERPVERSVTVRGRAAWSSARR